MAWEELRKDVPTFQVQFTVGLFSISSTIVFVIRQCAAMVDGLHVDHS